MCGFIAQLVEQRTGNAEVMGLNPVEALIFFRLLLSNSLKWKIYCNDHSSLSSTTAVQKWKKKDKKKMNYFIYFTSLTMSVALKSSLLTMRPGDSPQDQGSRPAGLGAWQVGKMQKRTGPIFSHLDQTRLAKWPKRTLFLAQPRQPWKSWVGNGLILPAR